MKIRNITLCFFLLIVMLSGAFASTDIFNLNFNDNSAPAGWTKTGGATWTFASGDARTNSGTGRGAYYKQIDFDLTKSFSFGAKMMQTQGNDYFLALGSGNSFTGSGYNEWMPTGAGYALTINCDDASWRIQLVKYNDASKPETKVIAGGTCTSGTAYNLKADHNTAGGWTFYVNNVVQGFATDTTFTTATYAIFSSNNDGSGNLLDDAFLTDNTVTSTCTYAGTGNWLVNLADNCNLTTNTTMDGSMFSTYGTGSLIINAFIRNVSSAHLIGSGIHWIGGGFK